MNNNYLLKEFLNFLFEIKSEYYTWTSGPYYRTCGLKNISKGLFFLVSMKLNFSFTTSAMKITGIINEKPFSSQC